MTDQLKDQLQCYKCRSLTFTVHRDPLREYADLKDKALVFVVCSKCMEDMGVFEDPSPAPTSGRAAVS